MRKSFFFLLLVVPLLFTCVSSSVDGGAEIPAVKTVLSTGAGEQKRPTVSDIGDKPAKNTAWKSEKKKNRNGEPALLPEISRGELVLNAFYKAYPEKISGVEYRDGDWAIQVKGTWFYWSGGRLLPEDVREKEGEYSPYPFYSYSRELPPLPELTDEEKRALEERLISREINPPNRHPGLYNTLWDVYDEDSSWRKVKTIFFLGHRTEIHRELLEDLAAVEEEVQQVMREDGEVRRYVESISQLHGYNWRSIAGTKSLSFHSYGTAVDLLPASYQQKQVYWRWAKPNFPEWYSLPYEKRFMPPEQVVRVFEKHGFIWGGKWFFFDTIHFEYRPEILILNGLRD